MCIFINLVELEETIAFILLFLDFISYPWELIFSHPHLPGWDMDRYYSLIDVLPCPDLVINVVENLAYTPRGTFDIVPKLLLVEGSVIIYGLNY